MFRHPFCISLCLELFIVALTLVPSRPMTRVKALSPNASRPRVDKRHACRLWHERRAATTMLADVSKLSLSALRPAATDEFYSMSKQEAQYRTIIDQREMFSDEIIQHNEGPGAEEVDLFRLPSYERGDGKWNYNVYDAEKLWRRIAETTPYDPIPSGWTRETPADAAARGHPWTGWINSQGEPMQLRRAPVDPITGEPIRLEDWILLRNKYGVPEELLARDALRPAGSKRYPGGQLAEPKAIAWRTDVPARPDYAKQTFEAELQQIDKLDNVVKALQAKVRDLEWEGLEQSIKEDVEKMRKLIEIGKQKETAFKNSMQRTYAAILSEKTHEDQLAEVNERLSRNTQQRDQLLRDDGETLEGWERVEEERYRENAQGEDEAYMDVFWRQADSDRVLRYRPTARNFEWQRQLARSGANYADLQRQLAQTRGGAAAVITSLKEQLRGMQRQADERKSTHEREMSNQKAAYEHLLVQFNFREEGHNQQIQAMAKSLQECEEKLRLRGLRDGRLKRALDDFLQSPSAFTDLPQGEDGTTTQRYGAADQPQSSRQRTTPLRLERGAAAAAAISPGDRVLAATDGMRGLVIRRASSAPGDAPGSARWLVMLDATRLMKTYMAQNLYVLMPAPAAWQPEPQLVDSEEEENGLHVHDDDEESPASPPSPPPAARRQCQRVVVESEEDLGLGPLVPHA